MNDASVIFHSLRVKSTTTKKRTFSSRRKSIRRNDDSADTEWRGMLPILIKLKDTFMLERYIESWELRHYFKSAVCSSYVIPHAAFYCLKHLQSQEWRWKQFRRHRRRHFLSWLDLKQRPSWWPGVNFGWPRNILPHQSRFIPPFRSVPSSRNPSSCSWFYSPNHRSRRKSWEALVRVRHEKFMVLPTRLALIHYSLPSSCVRRYRNPFGLCVPSFFHRRLIHCHGRFGCNSALVGVQQRIRP